MYIPYYHADVFTEVPFSGNGLSIFLPPVELPADRMLRITQEMKQFESIFVRPRPEGTLVDARVFTVEEELSFAGHPSIGAAAQLHALNRAGETEAGWIFIFPQKSLPIATRKTDYGYSCTMNQGEAEFGEPLPEAAGKPVLEALQIDPKDRDEKYPLQVVSTGLPYLLVPLKRNFTTANIGAEGLSEMLEAVGAKFIGLVDVDGRSMRTGDNLGKVEDIATGSLAGPVGAYLVRHGVAAPGEEIGLVQGVHLGRESRLYVTVSSDVIVRGGVVLLAEGRLLCP
ncbi:PhzF family phenazine biosynthesis protein [Dinghuibacter silviterrae]|uniref:PhzF family phenazine biosynthesis protein n=1 Tax=Dinghuibacter silviterrae TaxID=1539049 RepID=A0A4R8DSL2_9BACT|nr:PhzF family phenazine biosynthesis protein [Dinghuibacter silviterrae]TDX00848.1 PhzF family phenazine biosynthesis protein [Dinghuibacter silviterrae]